MDWQTLPTLAVDRESPKEFKSKITRLNKAGTEINAAANQLEADTRDFIESPQSGGPLEGAELAERQLQCLLSAQKWRWAHQELLAEYGEQVLPNLTDKAFIAHQESLVEVREKLVAIGFHDVPPTIIDPSKILPGWLFSHPKVIEAKRRHTELSDNKQHVNTAQRANEACLEDLAIAIRALKSKMSPAIT